MSCVSSYHRRLACISSLVLVALSLSVMAQSGYNETEAKRYADYTGAAYCTGGLTNRPSSSVIDWTCNACKKQPGMTNVTVVWNSSTNANGFVGYNAAGNFIMISFSGTGASASVSVLAQ